MSDYDPRWDEAEGDVDRGEPWIPEPPKDGEREEPFTGPNPLTFEAEKWVSITTKHGDAELLIGKDRDGKRWSKLIGGVQLQKVLIDGLIEDWNKETGTFEVVETLGKVEPGEIVSIRYKGKKGDKKYNDYDISRKPPLAKRVEQADRFVAPEAFVTTEDLPVPDLGADEIP